jgi:hypothetical protein
VPVPRLFPDTLLPCGSTQIPALDENQERICMSLFLTYCLAGSWLNTSAPFKILLLMHQALQALPSQSHEVDSLARVSQAAFFALEGQESRGHSHYTASSSSPPLAPASGTRATLPAASQRRAVGGPATGRRLGHPPTTKGVCPRISLDPGFEPLSSLRLGEALAQNLLPSPPGPVRVGKGTILSLSLAERTALGKDRPTLPLAESSESSASTAESRRRLPGSRLCCAKARPRLLRALTFLPVEDDRRGC